MPLSDLVADSNAPSVSIDNTTTPPTVTTKQHNTIINLLQGLDSTDKLALAILASAARGSVVVGNSTPAWSALALGGSGTYLRSNGTDLLFSAIQGADQVYGSSANTACQGNDSRLSDARTPTAHNILSAQHGDTVAASVVLGDLMYGNSTPAWQRLAGNTTSTRNFLRQTGTGSVSAAPAWDTLQAGDIPSLAASIITSGTFAEARGGTNQSTYAVGDTLYASAANTLSKLTGNTTTTRNFLRQVGNGSVSAAPAWDTLAAGDIPDISATYARTEQAEQSNTPVSDNGDTTIGTSTTYFTFYQMPSTYKWYVCTGIEWKNGATVNGSITGMVYATDGNPPSQAAINLLATTGTIVQSGTSTTQRSSVVGATCIIRGGTNLAIGFSTGSATATLRTLSGQASQNRTKASALLAPTTNSTAWSTGTLDVYGKIYYRGFG